MYKNNHITVSGTDMEAKGCARVANVPVVEGGNEGRFGLKAEYRQGVVNYVTKQLTKQLETDPLTAHSRSEIVRIATSFEDKVYRTVKTMDEYFNGLIRKLATLKLTDRKNASSTSNSGNHLSLQNLLTNSQALAGNPDKQRIYSNMLAEMKREILESSYAQQFVSRTQEFQKSSMRNQEAQTQNLNVRATGLHHNPNNLMQFQNTTGPIQQENCMQKRAEHETHHRNQQQRTQASSYQHPRYGAPCNLSEVYQPQQMIKSEIDALNMHQQRQQSHFFQQTRAAYVRQELHPQSRPLQIHVSPKQEKRSDSPRESSQLITQNQLSFSQSRTFTDQPNKSLRENVSRGDLSEPMELTGVPNIKAPNRHDESYRKVQRVKGMFLPYLRQLYSSFCGRRPEGNVAHSDEQHKYKLHVEGMIKFLQLSRNDIEQYPLDWVMDRLQTIVKFIKGIKMKRSENTQNHSHGSQLQTPSAVQLRSSNPQERSENIASASIPAVSSSLQISSPQGMPFLPLEKPDPYRSGRGRQNYMKPIISSSSATVSSSNALNSPTSSITYTQPGSALISSQLLMQQHQLQPDRRAGKQSIQQYSPSSLATLQHHHSETLHSKYPYQSLLPTNLHQSLVIPSDVPHKQSQKGLQESSTRHIPEAGKIRHAIPSIPPTISSPRAPMHTEKQVSGALTFGIAEKLEKSITPGSVAHMCSEKQTHNQGPANDASELEKSSILPEISNNGDNTPHVEEEPIQLLTKLVKTIKYEALSASAQDIAAIVSIGDRVGSSGSDETRVNIGEDFSAETRCRLQALDSISRCPAIKGIKRQLDATSWELHTIKRPRLTPNSDLLEEIGNINRQLFETVVDVMLDSRQQPVTSKAGEGTLIRCSYTAAAAAGKSLNTQHASRKMLPTLVLRLLVPPNYPNSSSSILVDGFSTDWKGQESEDFLEKTKANFSRYLEKSAEKTSLEEMVKAWNACAREVFYEFASAAGGGCLSSKYGKWENCVTAT